MHKFLEPEINSARIEIRKFLKVVGTIIFLIIVFIGAYIVGAIIGIFGVIALALFYIGYQLYKRNKILEKNLRENQKKEKLKNKNE